MNKTKSQNGSLIPEKKERNISLRFWCRHSNFRWGVIVRFSSENLIPVANSRRPATLESSGAVPGCPSKGILLLVTVGVSGKQKEGMFAPSFRPEEPACMK